MLTGGQTKTAAPVRWAAVPVGLLFVLVAAEWWYGWTVMGWSRNYGDLTIYTDATRRLFAGGSWYLERQLSGSYPLAFGDVLYPPVASLFFAPWLVLPGWSFVLVPSLIVAWLLADWQPSPWGWFAIGCLLLYPTSGLKLLSANPSVWIAAFVGLGLRYRWPGALVLLKPSFLPLALIGIRSRGWWAVVIGLAVLSLPFLGETLRWPVVALDAQGAGIGYSIGDLPLVLVPVVGWLGRDR